jgi:methionyl-tRNA formyltransferase
MSGLRIIYMGTPEFAVPALQTLHANGVNVVAVITAPDKPAGRGLKLHPSAVKAAAVELGIPVLQPSNLKDPSFQEELKSYKADLQIVVAFRMLPEAVWNMPPLGTFNLHASLLPKYRGAAPINWAIINGEKETGISTFFLKHEIDTGDIMFQVKEPILDNDNAGTLYERLMNKGAQLVFDTVKSIEADAYPKIPQVYEGTIPVAPKIHKETCQINFNKTSVEVRNHIRGLSPYPAAWTMLQDKHCKIYQVSLTEDKSEGTPGAYKTDNKTYLHFKTADGWISVQELQLEGKKKMQIDELLRGHKL